MARCVAGAPSLLKAHTVASRLKLCIGPSRVDRSAINRGRYTQRVENIIYLGVCTSQWVLVGGEDEDGGGDGGRGVAGARVYACSGTHRQFGARTGIS